MSALCMARLYRGWVRAQSPPSTALRGVAFPAGRHGPPAGTKPGAGASGRTLEWTWAVPGAWTSSSSSTGYLIDRHPLRREGEARVRSAGFYAPAARCASSRSTTPSGASSPSWCCRACKIKDEGRPGRRTVAALQALGAGRQAGPTCKTSPWRRRASLRRTAVDLQRISWVAARSSEQFGMDVRLDRFVVEGSRRLRGARTRWARAPSSIRETGSSAGAGGARTRNSIGEAWLPIYVLSASMPHGTPVGDLVALDLDNWRRVMGSHKQRRPVPARLQRAAVDPRPARRHRSTAVCAADGTGFKLRGFHSIGFTFLAQAQVGGWLLPRRRGMSAPEHAPRAGPALLRDASCQDRLAQVQLRAESTCSGHALQRSWCRSPPRSSRRRASTSGQLDVLRRRRSLPSRCGLAWLEAGTSSKSTSSVLKRYVPPLTDQICATASTAGVRSYVSARRRMFLACVLPSSRTPFEARLEGNAGRGREVVPASQLRCETRWASAR